MFIFLKEGGEKIIFLVLKVTVSFNFLLPSPNLDNVVYRTSFSLISIYAMHFPLSSWFAGAFSQSQKWRNKYPTYKLLIRLNIKHNHRRPLWCCCVSQKIFKIYKTYKLIQSARNTPNKSADMYKKTSYKLRTKLKNVLLTTHTAHQGL